MEEKKRGRARHSERPPSDVRRTAAHSTAGVARGKGSGCVFILLRPEMVPAIRADDGLNAAGVCGFLRCRRIFAAG